MGKTSIEWAEYTWTPLRARVKDDAGEIARAKGYTSLVQIATEMAGHVGPHCEPASPGCDHCYSEASNSRCLPANGTGLPFDRRARDLVDPIVDAMLLVEPFHWRTPRTIFVCSQTDLFGAWNTDAMIDRVCAVMALCRQHRFLVLTKQDARMREYFAGVAEDADELVMRWGSAAGELLDGDWIWNEGKRFRMQIERFISASHGLEEDCETQVSAENAVPFPLPNVGLGVSAEDQQRKDRIDTLRETPAAARFLSLEPLLEDLGALDLRGIDWVIVGGESGPGARPVKAEWVRSLRDQCVAGGVPFFFKQWGEYLPSMEDGPEVEGHQVLNASDEPQRVGKKAAGALLDGQEWRELPAFLERAR